jgi:predicted  nucleic acid-binding Zn-ribbon protein
LSPLDRLKEKVEAWKTRIRELEEANRTLSSTRSVLEEELRRCREGESQELAPLHREIDTLNEQLRAKEEALAALRRELDAKDAEIEAIIEKVEALLE